MTTLKTLFLDQLALTYDAEQEIVKALSWMAQLASEKELREALKVHACESMGHISKVEEVFGCFGEEAVGSRGNAISGLLAEAAALVTQQKGSLARDAAIISAAQKVESHEMTAYGCLRDWAAVLDNQAAAIILAEILGDEKAGDSRLSGLAHACNLAALEEAAWHGDEGSEEEPGLAYDSQGEESRHPEAV